VTGYGAINPGVQVYVFDNAQVWLDHSLSMQEKRKRQTNDADAVTDEQGRFAVKRLPEGFYEVEFRRDGWDVVSALVHVKHGGTKDQLCVVLRIESGPGEDSVEKCP